jgi:hypothetical protein
LPSSVALSFRWGFRTGIAMLAVFSLTGCGNNLDSPMWECQFAVQKENPGRSAEAIADRAVEIDACMSAKGYRRNTKDASCQHGTVDSSCYRAK